MMLVGMVWALLAPLLLLIPAAALVQWMHHGGWPVQPRWRWPVAVAAVLGAVLLVWLPQRWQFARLCDSLGAPRILQAAQADGFFLDDPTANSFGMRYLQEEGFAWLEARSIHHRERFTRYTRGADGGIAQREIDALTAAHALQAIDTQEADGTRVHRLKLTQRDTGAVLATAASAHFQGGPMRWVLGMWGTASCPNPVTTEGSRRFQATYHLARDTLRPSGAASGAGR